MDIFHLAACAKMQAPSVPARTLPFMAAMIFAVGIASL